MPLKTGITNSFKKISNSTRGDSPIQDKIDAVKGQLVAARVTDIVLDENHPKFENVGQWNGIGAIYFEFVNQTGTGAPVTFALPYDSQIKTYPLVNEIVFPRHTRRHRPHPRIHS